MTTPSHMQPSRKDAHMSAASLTKMLASQTAALDAVAGAVEAIAIGAVVMADVVRRGGTLQYAAAGSSGLMALADASELPGTFGIDQKQVAVHMAGGVPVNGIMPGDTEDSIDDAQRDAAKIAEGDAAIVISASGTTPYALAFAKTAKARGADLVCLANRPGSALLQVADVAIALPTAPEFVEGSTRLGAGTAQKVALNMMSTQMGVLLGHVHEGMMVNLTPDNIKLRQRAAGIVCHISAVSASEAEQALQLTGYNTKAAVLVARGLTLENALALLEKHDGLLSACLDDDTYSATTIPKTKSDFTPKGDLT